MFKIVVTYCFQSFASNTIFMIFIKKTSHVGFCGRVGFDNCCVRCFALLFAADLPVNLAIAAGNFHFSGPHKVKGSMG